MGIISKAAIIETERKIKLVELEVPPLGDEEVLVKVIYAGICGSDIKLFNGTYPGVKNYPIIPCHEWSGIVVETGINAKEFEIGTNVTGDCSLFCGECFECTFNKNLCKHIEKRGITTDGFCRQYVNVNKKHLYKNPGNISEKLLALAEPLAVVNQGFIRTRLSEDELRNSKILIIGAGPIGILTALKLKDIGADNITIIDFSEFKINMAKELGIREAILGDLNTAIAQLGSDYSLCVEASGASNSLNCCLEKIKPGGAVLALGNSNGATLNFDAVVRKSISICGSLGGTGGFHEAFKTISRNQPAFEKIITKMVSFDNVPFEIPQIINQTNNQLKIVIDFNT